MLRFREIQIADLPHIRSIVEQTGYRSCQLSAGGLYCLAAQYRTVICFEHDFLFISQQRPDVGLCYFMPIGTGNLASAMQKLKHYHQTQHSMPLTLWGVADDMTEDLKAACNKDLILLPDRNWAEYIHESQRLQTLAGKRLQPKRNAAHQFRRHYHDFLYEPITARNIEEVWHFQTHHPQLDGKLDPTIRRGLDMVGSNGFEGGIIKIDGAIQGYTIGCPINSANFDILFENANKACNGIFQVLEQELIASQIGAYQYINREEDLGVEGIRFAKMGLHPDILLMKYSVTIF